MDGEYSAGNIVEGSWIEEGGPSWLMPISHVGSNRLGCVYSFDINFKYLRLDMVTSHS